MMAWSMVFMAAAVGVLMVAVWLWLKPKINRSAGAAVVVPPSVRVVSEFESPTEEDALGLVRQALRIKRESEVAEYFHPGAAGAKGVIEFLHGM
jgi:hypothetical protein